MDSSHIKIPIDIEFYNRYQYAMALLKQSEPARKSLSDLLQITLDDFKCERIAGVYKKLIQQHNGEKQNTTIDNFVIEYKTIVGRSQKKLLNDLPKVLAGTDQNLTKLFIKAFKALYAKQLHIVSNEPIAFLDVPPERVEDWRKDTTQAELEPSDEPYVHQYDLYNTDSEITELKKYIDDISKYATAQEQLLIHKMLYISHVQKSITMAYFEKSMKNKKPPVLFLDTSDSDSVMYSKYQSYYGWKISFSGVAMPHGIEPTEVLMIQESNFQSIGLDYHKYGYLCKAGAPCKADTVAALKVKVKKDGLTEENKQIAADCRISLTEVQ